MQKCQILVIFVGLILVSCKNTPEIETKGETQQLYAPTEFPSDTSNLWIANGPIDADTVFVIGEGGPKNVLDFEADGRLYWEYLEGINNYHVAVIHQSSTLNKSFWDADLTADMAKKEVDNSSEIMYRVIKYFKNRNKYVVVFGHSYSAFIIPNYLATRPSLADKYIVTGGRLNADTLQTAYQLKGINTGFKEDGITLELPDENEVLNRFRTDRYFKIRKTKEMLKFAIGKPRYTNELKDVDLSNLVFYYGEMDQNVGALTHEEIDFLESKNAHVVGVETGHYDIWKRVVDAFRDGDLKL